MQSHEVTGSQRSKSRKLPCSSIESYDEKPILPIQSVGDVDDRRRYLMFSGLHNGWKPLSLSAPILGGLAVLTLLIAAAVEVLAQRSQANGGLAISSSLDSIPDYAMWSYLYGPNLVAVLYSLIWNWVDLDVRRMQPWLELSKPDGAKAEDSLLLDYPFDFVAFAPWSAAKKRHWSVFLASTNMLLVLWAITPLQSAFLATGVIRHVNTTRVIGRSQLQDVSKQFELMDSSIRGTIYHTTWLNLSFPAFTTPEYALAPFQISDETKNSSATNITADTTMFSSELSCSPARAVMGEFGVSENGQWAPLVPLYLLDNDGCNATVYPEDIIWRDTDPEISMRYWGSYTDDNFYELEPMDGPWRWELASPECPDVTNRFVAAWMKQKYNGDYDPPTINISAIWCNASYYKQEVRVQLSAKTKQPTEQTVQPLGPREQLKDTEFNSTAFEQFLKTGGLDQGPIQSQEIELFDHESFLFGTSLANLHEPVLPAVGYALAAGMFDIEAYADPEVLADAYSVAWKRQFALLAHRLMTNASDVSDASVEVALPMAAIIVSRAFAKALESLLVAVALLTLGLMWFCHRAHCNLRANPSSLSRLGDVSSNSPELCAILSSFGAFKDGDLKECLTGRVFKLEAPGAGYNDPPHIVEVYRDALSKDDLVFREEEDNFFEPIKPFALKKRSGVLFTLAITGAIIGLAYLKATHDSTNGLRRPTDIFEILQLLENYIPTIFATLVEPFWVMLNRLLCMLQPWKDLSRGKASIQRSIGATYTSVPPQLAVLRALKAGHIVLVMVCSTALVANLLTLSMGALFNEAPVKTEVQGSLAARFAPRIVTALPDIYRVEGRMVGGGPRKQHVIATQANVTDGLNMPVWTTPEYFFQPARLVDLPKAPTYTIFTNGFSLDANCTGYPAEELPLEFPKAAPRKNVCDFRLDDPDRVMRDNMGMSSIGNDPSGSAKFTFDSRIPSEVADEKGATLSCDPVFVWGFGRSNEAESRNGTATVSKVLCKPIFQVARFNVSVDGDGNVQSFNRTSDIANELSRKDSKDHIRMMIGLVQDGGLLGVHGWYNDTSFHGVFDMLLAREINSTAVVDPTKPLPDTKMLAPAIERIYRQLFVSMLSLNTGVFADAESADAIQGIAQVEEVRIFMSGPAFIITMVILGINLAVTFVFYAQTSTLVLPRLPTTIGSAMAYIAPSRLMTEGIAEHATYSFGRYLGQDGRSHVGVERDPYVVPIVSGSLGGKPPLRQRLKWGKRDNEKEQQPWL